MSWTWHPNIAKPTPEEIEKWRKEDQERHTREREHLHEFELISKKVATKMPDLTEEESGLWKQWLEEEVGDLPEDLTDLFDRDEDFEFCRDEIRVMRWKWRDQILIDMNAWPGDAETGAVFLNGEIICTQAEGDFGLNDDDFPSESFSHVRYRPCQDEDDYDNNHPAHEHCREIEKKYDELLS